MGLEPPPPGARNRRKKRNFGSTYDPKIYTKKHIIFIRKDTFFFNISVGVLIELSGFYQKPFNIELFDPKLFISVFVCPNVVKFLLLTKPST